jgi:hypothetical protein
MSDKNLWQCINYSFCGWYLENTTTEGLCEECLEKVQSHLRTVKDPYARLDDDKHLEGYYSNEARKIDRISRFLSNTLNGLIMGSTDYLCKSVSKRLSIPYDHVKVVIDKPAGLPKRIYWSIHVDHYEEHYESIARNILYFNGDEG